MATIYLAYNETRSLGTWGAHRDARPVNALVAFPYMKRWNTTRAKMNIGRWVFDSGAFTAHNSGKPVKIAEYIAACKDCDAAEIFALDAIGDPVQTRKNCERMWEAGVAAIPTVHHGASEADIDWVVRHSEKIAIGGIARLKGKSRFNFVARVFKRVWPKRIHGFGLTGQSILAGFPFDSVDSASWTFGPHVNGRWLAYAPRVTAGQFQMPNCYGATDAWAEVEAYFKREKQSEYQWRRELARLPRRVGNSVTYP